jgi:hypothetical protein
MNRQEIKELQAAVNTAPDGIWGNDSISKCQAHLRRLMPSPNPWPESGQSSLRAFYGSPGDESQLVNLPVDGLGVRYLGAPVKTVRCHRKVAESLGRVIEQLSNIAPDILLEYAGCFNNRSVRGGSAPSLHAYGAAIDFAPDTNGNNAHWPTNSTMPLKVMEAFAREGWLPAGAFWHRDAMHFQATR